MNDILQIGDNFILATSVVAICPERGNERRGGDQVTVQYGTGTWLHVKCKSYKEAQQKAKEWAEAWQFALPLAKQALTKKEHNQ